MSTKPQRTRVAAYALITEDSNVLLCRISDQLPQHHGKWTLPGGGIEFGETPEEATVREVEEETGLQVSISSIEHVDSIIVETSDANLHSIRVLYKALVTGGKLRNEVNGTTDLCQWRPLTELPDMVDLAIIGTSLVHNRP